MPHRHLTELLRRLPELATAESSILQAYEVLRDSFQAGGKVLLCGNGGSAADADHWAGNSSRVSAKTGPYLGRSGGRCVRRSRKSCKVRSRRFR